MLPLKLLLVDDHPIFLEGLKNLLLAHGMESVDTAAGGEEALEKVGRTLPDVVLMDIMMKPLSGPQTALLIKAKYPDVKIIMLTASETEEDLFESIKSGASGYLSKSLDADTLLEMLHQYEQGEIPVSPGLANQMLQEFKRNDDGFWVADETNHAKMKQLSPRQKEVLILVADGMKYKEIAATLGVTERTVKYHMEEILRKLHLENRSQAVKYIIREGMVD
jgi:DNA-binding NarL/FixJ family response regulator